MLNTLASSYKCVIVAGSVLYAVSLLLLLLKKSETEVQHTLRLVDPSLGTPVPVVDWANECGINNVMVALYDVHVITHILGWFLTTLAFRDVAFSWVCGLIWEVIEGSFEQNIPELRECWWDKVFMDLLGCNNLGIFLGWIVLRYLKMEEFNWARIATPDGSALHEVGILYFLPGRRTLQQNYYGIVKSAKTCMLYIYAHLVIILLQLNIFFLKTALWIPTVHWIPSCRSFLIASLLILSGSSVYKRHDFTGFPLLMNMVLALEGLLVLRFGTGLLFAGKGDTLTTMLMIISIFVFLILSLVGMGQLFATKIKPLCTSCCKCEKVQ